MSLWRDGAGALRDQRRPLPAGGFAHPPLGPDPEFPTTNFEIEAVLVAGSDPESCEEGQEVRATAVMAAGAHNKSACSAGRPLPSCRVNAQCDTYTCQGGTMAGEICHGTGVTPAGRPILNAALCVASGGNCTANGDGVCTAYPFAGAARGNDDYRAHSPGDEAIKLVCPGCRSPR